MITRPEQLADIDTFLTTAERWADLGIDQVWVGPSAEDATRWVNDLCARVLPRLQTI